MSIKTEETLIKLLIEGLETLCEALQMRLLQYQDWEADNPFACFDPEREECDDE